MRSKIAAIVLVLIALGPTPALRGQRRGTPAPRRAPAKPQPPMTMRQVIESLTSLRSTSKVEDLVSKRGVQFQANPGVLEILKEFGAGPKLLAMIPVPPPPPAPPAPKIAGALTVTCEPVDCSVIVGDKFEGPTAQNHKVINELPAGQTKLEVFADGFESATRTVDLADKAASEQKFTLKRSQLVRQQSASVSMMQAVTSLGSVGGLTELGDFEGSGVLHWVDSDGQTQEWNMTFNKRVGNDVSITFKTRDGQCSASLNGQTAKQDCKGGLKLGGDKIAEQATSLFVSYQIQDVIGTLLRRPLITSEASADRIESDDEKDSYILTLDKDGLPVDLVYRIGDSNSPIEVQYSDYINMSRGRYPGRIAIGRLNAKPVWIFTVTSVKSRIGRN